MNHLRHAFPYTHYSLPRTTPATVVVHNPIFESEPEDSGNGVGKNHFDQLDAMEKGDFSSTRSPDLSVSESPVHEMKSPKMSNQKEVPILVTESSGSSGADPGNMFRLHITNVRFKKLLTMLAVVIGIGYGLLEYQWSQQIYGSFEVGSSGAIDIVSWNSAVVVRNDPSVLGVGATITYTFDASTGSFSRIGTTSTIVDGTLNIAVHAGGLKSFGLTGAGSSGTQFVGVDMVVAGPITLSGGDISFVTKRLNAASFNASLAGTSHIDLKELTITDSNAGLTASISQGDVIISPAPTLLSTTILLEWSSRT